MTGRPRRTGQRCAGRCGLLAGESSVRLRGFTLVELLSVLAIIALLVGLLLPAVQQAREAARRTQCQNQLKQFGLALHGYHDVHQVLPSGALVLGPSFPTLSGWGWGAMILPHLDQAPLYGRINFDAGTAVDGNRDVIPVPVPIWRCPSDTLPPTIVAPINGHPDASIAAGNVVASRGVMSAVSSVRFADVTDGLSQTLLVGERVHLPATSGSLEFTSAWCGFVSAVDKYVYTSTPYVEANRSRPINRGLTSPDCFSSRHPAGANFCLADGSVRFVSEFIDMTVLEALGTPDGGERVEH